MGADGHIEIWKRADVEKEWPDCAELFDCLPTHYCDELDGNLYDHVYWGENIWYDWTNPDNFYIWDDKEDKLPKMLEFVKWLVRHSTHWEVWT